ncbi:MAG: ATP-binding protein [Spirochaetales bacterium]|nr:MAG: ATP-binding protein [Spirochaetales bacterium]
MKVYAFEPIGFDGELVTVEVDLRRGIPAVDIVGLPDGAVKESRERVRASIRNSGYEFPLDRLLINLAPAGLRKAGASFDLPIALAVLVASGQVPDFGDDVLAMGELELSGAIRGVPGILPAVAAGLAAGVKRFLVPLSNVLEARVLAGTGAFGMERLAEASGLSAAMRGGTDARSSQPVPVAVEEELYRFTDDLADIRGQPRLRRALEVAAAGGHHLLLFGPPGAGKTMAARRLPGLLPDLEDTDAIASTKLHSLAGVLPLRSGLLRRPPFRTPHHSASTEGVVGGGKIKKPGEISLAHGGVLFLDEAPEFRIDVLQALREPLEEGMVSIARADRTVRYPSAFTLVLACNPCPCGNLGRQGGICLCSHEEIRKYWKRLGGPLLDRVDIRVPVKPTDPRELASPSGESTDVVKERVRLAREIQNRRYHSDQWKVNARLPPGGMGAYCSFDGDARSLFIARSSEGGLSSRASHGVLRVARTLADLVGAATIGLDHLDEAFSLRHYGDEDLFWQIP